MCSIAGWENIRRTEKGERTWVKDDCKPWARREGEGEGQDAHARVSVPRVVRPLVAFALQIQFFSLFLSFFLPFSHKLLPRMVLFTIPPSYTYIHMPRCNSLSLLFIWSCVPVSRPISFSLLPFIYLFLPFFINAGSLNQIRDWPRHATTNLDLSIHWSLIHPPPSPPPAAPVRFLLVSSRCCSTPFTFRLLRVLLLPLGRGPGLASLIADWKTAHPWHNDTRVRVFKWFFFYFLFFFGPWALSHFLVSVATLLSRVLSHFHPLDYFDEYLTVSRNGIHRWRSL